ncbi:MAG: nucleotide exchange factor GrpE, partial [Patescibacteria group bacterium]|nr:nucleotide exchange factor GrpE [Patescibacteria group bacterium]
MDEQHSEQPIEDRETVATAAPDVLQECARLRDEYLAGWQRAKADYQNLQRDLAHRLEEASEEGRRSAMREWLTVADHLEIAAKNLPEGLKGDAWASGVLDVGRDLERRLGEWGLTVIETKGKPFSPEYHEAVGTVASDEPEGTIIEEIQRGYLY